MRSFFITVKTRQGSPAHVKGKSFLNFVVGQGFAIFQIPTSTAEVKNLWRDTFFLLDFCLDVFNAVGRLNHQGDDLSGKGSHENLHFVM